jgi:YhcH/YjgK/YiaL family protein
MILDSLDRLRDYVPLHSGFGKVCDYLETVNLADLPEGRHEIEGSAIFLTISENRLRSVADAPLEVHDKYIDIQIPLRGSEQQAWMSRSDCRLPHGEKDTERDILFFSDKPTCTVALHEGQMTIFFPSDAHAPLIGEGTVRKCVVKVPL